jgi:hypothetical protein
MQAAAAMRGWRRTGIRPVYRPGDLVHGPPSRVSIGAPAGVEPATSSAQETTYTETKALVRAAVHTGYLKFHANNAREAGLGIDSEGLRVPDHEYDPHG